MRKVPSEHWAKATGGGNPNNEIRNSKQIQITKKENPKQDAGRVLDLGDLDFEFVSDFDIRISDFPTVLDFFFPSGLAEVVTSALIVENRT
jgi:hypothetical protein